MKKQKGKKAKAKAVKPQPEEIPQVAFEKSDDGLDNDYKRVASRKRAHCDAKHNFNEDGPHLYKLIPCEHKMECIKLKGNGSCEYLHFGDDA